MRDPKTSKNSKGQALVEMALVLFLLLLLVLGIFEFGRAMYIKNTLAHSARAGARAAVVTYDIINENNATCSTGGNNTRIYQTVCANLFNGIDPNDVRVDVEINDFDSSGGLNAGDMIKVTVKLENYRTKYLIVPFIPVKNTLIGTNAMRYE